jgi:hypothetical protein
MPSEVQGKWLPIPGDLYGNGTFALGSARNSGASPQFKSADGAPDQSKLQMRDDQAWWLYRLFILKGDVEPTGLPEQFVTLTENKSFSENSPPDLVDVSTPLEDTDTFVIVSPYAPNVKTDQSQPLGPSINPFGTRTGTNGSLESPSTTSEYQLQNMKYEVEGGPLTSTNRPSWVLGAWKPTAS